MKQFMENEKIELKKSTSLINEALISMVSILNKHGKGELYFGINNEGIVVGQDITEKTLRNISQKINEQIEPKIYVHIDKITIDNKHCIIVSFEGNEKPYFARGIAYIRVADEDRRLSPNELKKFILNANTYAGKWDKELSVVHVAEINAETLKRFITQSEKSGRLSTGSNETKEVLNKLELANDNVLTQAARFLFTDRHDMEVQAAVFAGTDKVTFLDIKAYKDNLFNLLSKAELYLKEHINWEVEIGKTGTQRMEIPEIPLASLREALVNSIIHRDYANPKGNEIAVFKDRVEIFNPGTFPEGLTPQDFIRGNEHSYLRNPKIAEIFYYAKEIERWGSGLKRIDDECRKNQVKVEFIITKSGFISVFHRKKNFLKKPDIVEPSKISTGETVGKTVGKTVGIILHAIKNNSKITRDELSIITGLSIRGVEWNLAKLKDEGKIKRIGPAKGGHWEVNEIE